MKPRRLALVVRRKKAKVPDEAQSSLDRFSGAPDEAPIRSSADDAIVPAMPDLDLLEQAETKLSNPHHDEDISGNDELRRFRMPSSEHEAVSRPPTSSSPSAPTRRALTGLGRIARVPWARRCSSFVTITIS